VLDRAAVRYFVAPPEVAPFGRLSLQPSDGTEVDLTPDVPITVNVHVDAGLRGIGIVPATDRKSSGPLDQRMRNSAQASTPVPAESPDSSAHLDITIRDSSGRVLATGERQSSDRDGDRLVGGAAWFVPLAAENIPIGTDLTAEITAVGTTPLRVAATNGVPTLATVTAVDDGLHLVYARESVIYERTRALDRAHWASAATVVDDPKQAVQKLATGSVGPSTVVLASPGPTPSGMPATVSWITDGLDTMALSVQAQGAGYLVLADAIQDGWEATVDGADAAIVSADRAFVAVAVPAGTHTVRFSYPQPLRGTGAYTTGLTVLILLAILVAETWLRRRRSKTFAVASAG
jgi:hypothetical protein